MTRFSEKFNLGRSQGSLEFVDIDISNDVPLFVDPGAIRNISTTFAHECASTVQSFFGYVVDLLRDGDTTQAHTLLSSLGETNETRLGFSRGEASGRGMAGGLAERMEKALAESRAVQTGILQDLEDSALFIDGIGPDIISDVVTNIIRGPLLTFTRDMTLKYGITTEPGISMNTWDRRTKSWQATVVNLPVAGIGPIVLVPRMFVRRRRNVYSADQYYQHYVVPLLQDEHLRRGSSLVRLLIDGSVRPPYKKTIKDHYPEIKGTNVDVTNKNRSLLDKYKEDGKRNFELVGHEELAKGIGIAPPDFDLLLQRVLAVPPGTEHANSYHRAVEEFLTAAFYPALDMPKIEQPIYEGRKRIDIDYVNEAARGFFHWAHSVHGTHCSFIAVECKNYGRSIKNPEFDQLSGRFSTQRGNLGILCYRGFADKTAVRRTCRDTATSGRGYIIALDDDDLTKIAEERKKLDSGEDFRLLYDRFRELM